MALTPREVFPLIRRLTGALQSDTLALAGQEAIVTRGTLGKPEVPKKSPEQALTVAELIEAYTVNAAWSLLVDEDTGSIETGKSADMIVLNHNLFEIPATDIHRTEVLTTLIQGRPVSTRE